MLGMQIVVCPFSEHRIWCRVGVTVEVSWLCRSRRRRLVNVFGRARCYTVANCGMSADVKLEKE